MNNKIAVILGAGFSRNVDLPTQDEFMELLVSPCEWLDDEQKVIDSEITIRINEFLQYVFFWKSGQQLPTLEEVFTFIDMSAGSGHNLGRNYTPSKLRAIRRFFIYKMFTILDKKYNDYSDGNKIIDKFLSKLKDNAGFISLNWDIVLERSIIKNYNIDYGIGGILSKIENNKLIAKETTSTLQNINIAKVHGSSNWVYCDNCKKLYYALDEKVAKSVYAGIYVEDVKRFYKPKETPEELSDIIRNNAQRKNCPNCGCSVGSHIATFSYRKSFRTNYFVNSWSFAEKILDESNKWIFVGYSLPDADYEFKHMLKCLQIRGSNTKLIHAIVKEDDKAENKYNSIFGKENIVCFQGGLDEYINSPKAFV